MADESRLRCIVCLEPTPQLYRKTDADCIKLIECVRCGSVVDRYVECEASVVLLELLLLDAAAFRHILHNSSFASSWEVLLKVLVCELLSEGYLRWTVAAATPSYGTSAQHGVSAGQEMHFYAMCILAAFEILIYGALIFGYAKWTKELSVGNAARCVLLGAFSSGLHIPATVWEVALSPAYRASAALYALLAQGQALRGTLQCGRVEAAAVVVTSAAVTMALSAAITQGLPLWLSGTVLATRLIW